MNIAANPRANNNMNNYLCFQYFETLSRSFNDVATCLVRHTGFSVCVMIPFSLQVFCITTAPSRFAVH